MAGKYSMVDSTGVGGERMDRPAILSVAAPGRPMRQSRRQLVIY